jgi:ribosome-associated protein
MSPLPFDENELHFTAVQSAGPGGQNVNKTATAIQLRVDVAHSPSLPEDVRQRLLQLGGSRVTNDGELIIQANRYRTQEQNRQDALDRLAALIHQASQKPKIRHKTRPTLASRQRRLESKRRKGEIKHLRRSVEE